MAWHTTSDLDEFDARAGGFLRARPVPNTVELFTLESPRPAGEPGGEPARFGWWRPAGGPVGGAFLHPPRGPGVVLTDLPPAAIPSLVDALGQPGQLTAEHAIAEAVAAEVRRRTGATATIRQRVWLYRLGDLTPRRPAPPGLVRRAGPGDQDLVRAWYALFMHEFGEDAGDLSAVVDDWIDRGTLLIWETSQGPVSMAGRSRPVAGTVRIGPVYTPGPLRGRGYAGAVTAAASRAARELAGEVVLLTEAGNAPGNAVYQRLGYQRVAQRLVLAWT